MCLGDVARVLEPATPDSVVVEAAGKRRVVSTMVLADPPAVGDWLLVHSGFAMHALDPDEAAELIAMQAAVHG